MLDVYRQLLRHSGVYALGQIFARLTSVVLLPVYTRYLAPADYAAIAILDLTTGILSILIGSGMAAALIRHHFEGTDENYRDRVWGTGVAFVAVTATAIVFPAWLLREELAHAALGPAMTEGAFYFSLVLPQLWSGTLGQVPEAHLRAEKRSGIYVVLSLARLLLNLSLNLLLLIRFEMGVSAILVGNLLASGFYTVVQMAILVSRRGLRIDPALVPPLWRYGRPLVLTALLSLLMHNGDRYILRLFMEMEAIGLYSLAYVIGQGINTTFLFPLSAIWGTLIFEIAAGPEPEKVFADVFRRYFHALSLLMLGVSLFAHPTFRLLVASEYWPASDLVPIVCLAYIFFSLHDQFRTPVVLSKRTSVLLPVFVIGTVVNISLNMASIPFFGVYGAAWTSVISFAAFSLFGLSRYRRIARYPYPLRHCGLLLAGMIITYVAVRSASELLGAGILAELGFAGTVWTVWTFILFRDVLPVVRSMALRAANP